MAKGKITKIVRDRGFGIIHVSDSKEEVFFHSSSVDQPTFDELKEGQKVEFDLVPDPKQPERSRAEHVRLGS